MASRKRTTVELDPDLYRILRIKAAWTGESVSELVHESVRRDLDEEVEDLEAWRARAGEPSLELDAVLAERHPPRSS